MGVTIDRLLEIADLPEQRSGTAAFSFRTRQPAGREPCAGGALNSETGHHRCRAGTTRCNSRPKWCRQIFLASLLPRFYDATAGRIMIADNPIGDIRIGELKKSVCLVPQDSFLTHASLRENITLNCGDVDPSFVQKVVSTVQLSDLVERLPDGLDTIIGYRGFPVSRGERQRICRARGLLQDAEILILDEALSGVDIEMERQILADVRRSCASKNLFVITHRVRSVMDFDRLIVLESGVVIASGPPNKVAGNYSPSAVGSVSPRTTCTRCARFRSRFAHRSCRLNPSATFIPPMMLLLRCAKRF